MSTLEYYKGKVAGIKVYFDTAISDVLDISPLKEITEFAHENNLIVMVHSSNSPVPMAEMVSVLKKGDILTHAYHGGVHNASEDCYECLKIAKEKGVITDTGFAGNIHANFGVLRGAAETGCVPDCISTDITKFNAYKRGGRYGMTMCMSMAGELGMKEEDIFRSVTSSPAKALQKENEWGFLKEGRCADVAVFDYKDEAFRLTDAEGNTVSGYGGYRCILTIVDGEVVYRI